MLSFRQAALERVHVDRSRLGGYKGVGYYSLKYPELTVGSAVCTLFSPCRLAAFSEARAGPIWLTVHAGPRHCVSPFSAPTLNTSTQRYPAFVTVVGGGATATLLTLSISSSGRPQLEAWARSRIYGVRSRPSTPSEFTHVCLANRENQVSIIAVPLCLTRPRGRGLPDALPGWHMTCWKFGSELLPTQRMNQGNRLQDFILHHGFRVVVPGELSPGPHFCKSSSLFLYTGLIQA